MISFLRIVNNIKVGNYLHSDGTIDDKVSPDIIGICVIPSDFLPDGRARFLSIQQSISLWGIINIDRKYKRGLPSRKLEEFYWGSLSSNRPPYLVPPYLLDGSINPEFLIDLPHGNAFQDFKGYENTKKYKEKYGDSEDLENAFSSCFRISPSYRKSEWYLPAIGELALLIEKKPMITSAISAGSPGVILSDNTYWSSSEYDFKNAWSINMEDGIVGSFSKNFLSYIRPFLAL